VRLSIGLLIIGFIVVKTLGRGFISLVRSNAIPVYYDSCTTCCQGRIQEFDFFLGGGGEEGQVERRRRDIR